MPRNRFIIWLVLALLAVTGGAVSTSRAQGTAFTYQGLLNGSNGPANGIFDLQFTSFNAISNGTMNGGPVIVTALPVTNGLLLTTVDFGPGVFIGTNNWLEIGVRTNAGTNVATNFTILTPRQFVFPVPYAITAENIAGGGGVLTGLNASQLTTGTVSNSRLATNVAFLDTNQTFTGVNNFAANVGIGVPSPNFPLSMGAGTGDKIALFGSAGAHIGFGVQSSLLQIHAASAGDSIAFGYGSSGSFTELMRIKGNGNFGIGNPNPGAPLDVLGAMQVNSHGTIESLGTASTAGSFNGMIESSFGAGDRYGLAQLSNGITALYASSTFGSSSIQLGQMTGASSFSPQVTIDHGGNVNVTGQVGANLFVGDGSGLFNVRNTVPPPNLKQVALLKWGMNSGNNSFTVGNTPRGICFDGANVWVANWNSGNVTKLDAITGTSAGNFSAGTGPRGVCFDGQNIWVANTNGFAAKLNASTGSSIASYGVGLNPSAICFDGSNIWVANSGGGNVTKLSSDTGTTIGTYTVGSTPSAICFDGSNIWTANFTSGNVSRLNSTNGSSIGTYSVGLSPCGICYDGSNIWVANSNSASVTKLDAFTGASLGTYTVGTAPVAVCYDGANIWVANFGSANVMKLEIRTGAVLGTYPAGTNPNALCFDGASIWVVNPGGTVRKL